MRNSASKPQYINPRDKPCDMCNGSEFTWGMPLVGKAKDPSRDYIFFRPEGSTFEDGDIMLHARHCERCGRVLLFTVDS